MSTESLNTYNWSSNTYERIPGTTDWVEVADISEGGYDWTEFRAFYSPSARRYFWHGDSGCSCNSWADGIASAANFEDGDKGALRRAWEFFAKERSYTFGAADYLNGVEQINKFEEPNA